jgi:hypothetical protein
MAMMISGGTPALLDAIERGPVRAHQGLAAADQRAPTRRA